MLVDSEKKIHLTYCQNVHPAENWQQGFDAIKQNVPTIKSQVSPNKSFGIGMRISDFASREINDNKLAEFKEYLDCNDLYVFTINAFPYANFSQPPVKKKVYLPTWAEKKRADYTVKVAEILSKIMPATDEIVGSISTVPLGYKSLRNQAEFLGSCAANIENVAKKLRDIFEQTGQKIKLAIEPEPDCVIETTAEAISFFDKYINESWIRDFIGICFDTSHQTVEFEDISQSLAELISAEIQIPKVQMSSAFDFTGSKENIELVSKFVDPVFLHQVKVLQNKSAIVSYEDLDVAIKNHKQAFEENWRVHFHVPVFSEKIGQLNTTRNLLLGEFSKLAQSGVCNHFEIETYTWGILANQNQNQIQQGIVNEYRWVLENIFQQRLDDNYC